MGSIVNGRFVKARAGGDFGWGSCCCCVIIFIALCSLGGLLVSLVNGSPVPTLSIEKLYIPCLNISANDTSSSTISFDLRLKNNYRDKLPYDPINVTFFYGHNLSLPVGGVTIPDFTQGSLKKAHKKETVEVFGVPWEEVRKEVLNATIVFRVEVATKVSYKLKYNTIPIDIMVGGNITVNDKGEMSSNKGVKLSSVKKKCVQPRLSTTSTSAL